MFHISTPTWTEHFLHNMREMGMPTPDGIFEMIMTLLATVGSIEEAIRMFGLRVTFYELVKAGLLSEKLLAASALIASAFAGAMIGSAIVATTRTLGGMGPEELWVAIEQASRMGLQLGD